MISLLEDELISLLRMAEMVLAVNDELGRVSYNNLRLNKGEALMNWFLHCGIKLKA